MHETWVGLLLLWWNVGACGDLVSTHYFRATPYPRYKGKTRERETFIVDVCEENLSLRRLDNYVCIYNNINQCFRVMETHVYIRLNLFLR